MTGQVDLQMVREGHPRAIELACRELELARAVVEASERYDRVAGTWSKAKAALKAYLELLEGSE